ncbi:MAG: hypothetical protein HYV34_04705 [Candidatus Kerfeldbacteria bacterium]|nr:hypothetical protein [Candidatus Kerfeldbacteria bacterium]
MRIYITGREDAKGFEEDLQTFGGLVYAGNVRVGPNERLGKDRRVELLLGVEGEVLEILASTRVACSVLHLGREIDYRKPNVYSVPCESEGDRLNSILKCDAFCFYPGRFGGVRRELVWVASSILWSEAEPLTQTSPVRPRRVALGNGTADEGDWNPIVVESLQTVAGWGSSSWDWWLKNCSTAPEAYAFLTAPAPVSPTHT